MILPYAPLSEQWPLATAQHKHMDLPLQQRPTPLLAEHSYSVPQHHHKPSGLESSWKSSYQTAPKLTRSMLLNPEQMHRVPEGSSWLKYGSLRTFSQALQEEYAFLTHQLCLTHSNAMSTSVRPVLYLNPQRKPHQAHLTFYYHLSRPQLIIPPPCRLTLIISSRRRQESNFSRY